MWLLLFLFWRTEIKSYYGVIMQHFPVHLKSIAMLLLPWKPERMERGHFRVLTINLGNISFTYFCQINALSGFTYSPLGLLV